jgi:hypothetical protein
MYASRSSVEQVYSELYGDVDEIAIEEGSSVSGTAEGKLGAFMSTISGGFSGELTKNEIKSINFDDEFLKAKRLANEILSDDSIPHIGQLRNESAKLNQLYRFSCEVMTKPFESEIDNQTYIKVAGVQDDIRFRGDTSFENWGGRSHLVQSVRASKRGETYPYQGLMWPLSVTESESEMMCYDVDFLLICGPERELQEAWFDKTIE